ncbi:MAG: Bax inhibitor-1/YccA family protein [Planctomycetota bacterium]|jgi:uncharacterized YccA/Bax inhibitor family protein|nr:Bax inhibitor-1/YccA family protein [Planctomycetota bacterium]MDP7131292.1 Bax inhibitor-1/YccA family protein [Planctomycetota bacterium]MDP7252101.1 Bax inhibitor-1/YccA family protein [Planctomycetota bacterium]
MRSSNPTINENTWNQFGAAEAATSRTMTIEGVINKTGIFAVLTVLSAGYVWATFFKAIEGMEGDPMAAGAAMGKIMPFVIGGMIVSILAWIVTCFKKEWSMVVGGVYSLAEGLFLGGLSAYFEAQFPGIVMQAVALTFGVLFTMLAAYRMKLIRASGKAAAIFIAGMGAIFFVWIGGFILSMFFGVNVMIFGANPIGIAFSVVLVGFAAFSLIFAFDFIETGARNGAPKYMEWYAAFYLMTELTWLYLEILRLLWKIKAYVGND